MKKIMAVAAIVVLVVLVGAPVAQAQYYGQSEASRAMSGGRQIMGESVAIGGIIGAVVGSVKDSRDRRRANQAYVDCQATVAQQSSQRQAYQATPSRRESDRVSQQTGLTIINRVRVLVRVSVDGGDFIYIDPSDEISIPEPQDSVRAEFREVRSGRVSWKRAEVRENDKLDGFEVVLPRQ